MTDTSAPAATSTSADRPVLCTSVEDFWTAESRRAIARFVGPFLDDSETTPLELLHAPRLQQAFEAHVVRRTVSDRAARVQAAAHGLSPATRKQDIDRLIKEVGIDVRQRLKKTPPAVIPTGGYVTAVGTLQTTEAPGFAIDAAITLTLAGCKNRLAKVELLLDFCETAAAGGGTTEAEALDRADRFLGEQIAAPGLLRDLSHHADNLRDRINTVLDLHLGIIPQDVLLAPTLRRLQTLLIDHPMPGCRNGLIDVLQDELKSEERLVPAVTGDLMGQKTLLADLMATADLAKRLKQPDGFIGGRRTHDALDRRVGLLVSTEKLQEVMRGKSVLEKLRDLFHLQSAVAVASSTKTLDDYILLLMESRDFVGRLYDAVEGPDLRMRALAELQALVLQSSFSQAQRKSLAKALDSAQHDLLKTTSILSTLRKATRPPIDAVLTVVDLAGDDAFTRGRCLAEARELIRRHVRHKDFVRKYLKSLAAPKGDAAEDGAEASTDIGPALAALAVRVRKAGVEFTDLSALRILVAEDEDSARSYIEMVLKDMGVGSVVTAHDGRAALEVFQDFEDGIDMIICDWMMPRMSGLDFLKQVRSVRPKLPFLMVTALATVENVEEAMQHEVTAYIAKPFPPEQLEEKVLLLVNRAAPSQDDTGGEP